MEQPVASRADVIDRLPHRRPFLFLTDVTSLNPSGSAEGRWVVSGDEDFFRGHFPGEPLVPGVLIVESLAQLSGLVALGDSPGRGRLAHSDVRFDAPVVPPAEIVLHSRQTREFGSLRQFDVHALLEGKRVARGTLTLSIDTAGAGGAS